MTAGTNHLRLNETTWVTVDVSPRDPATCAFEWQTTAGVIQGGGSSVTYQAPAAKATVTVTVRVRQGGVLVDQASCRILVYKSLLIVKADDLLYDPSLPPPGIPSGWQVFMDYMRLGAREKASIGLITASLETGTAAYRQRIIDHAQTGYLEFWHHGYTHEHYGEMTAEVQLQHLQYGSQLAEQYLGLTLHGFGAPYNDVDSDTVWAMDRCPNMKYWLWGLPYTGLTLNDRIKAELVAGDVDYNYFVSNYRVGSSAKCRVTQVHPGAWPEGSGEFADWKRIVEFLKSEGVTFILPYEYWRLLNEPGYVPAEPGASPPMAPPPTVPQDVMATALSSSSIGLSWTASTDSVGVSFYRVYRDGTEIGTTAGTSYTDTGLAASTLYAYALRAVDAAGYQSSLSIPALATTSPDASLAANLWLGLAFEEATLDQVWDSSSYGHDGTLTTGVLRSASGRYGRAVEFTGNGGFVSLGNLDIPGSVMTLACWFKADDFGDSVARLISKAAGSADADHYWMLGTVDSGGMKIRYRLKTANGGTVTLVSTVGIAAGVWTHVAATYDGATMRLYINGQAAGSLGKTGEIVQNASVPVALGAQPQGDRRFDGLMDELRIYTRPLTATEIQTVMGQALGVPNDTTPPSMPQGLVAAALSSSSIELTWSASTDDMGVSFYRVYRDGVLIGTSATTGYTDNDLAASTTYSYTVQAVDIAGNQSPLSPAASAATPSAPPANGDLWLGMGFEEATGNQVLDSSTYGHNGTLTTGMLRSVSGRYGRAVEFTGNGGYVSLGNLDIPGSAMTLACWFRADDFGDSVARLISKAVGSADADHYWMLGTVNSGGMKIRYRLKTTEGLSTLVGTVGIAAGVWTHVAATYDGATMRLYVNGQTAGSLARTGAILQGASVPVALGAQPQGDRRFDGLMDEVRIYTRALTATEIQSVMGQALSVPNDTTPPSTPQNLVATALTASTIGLTWSASTDDVGVVSYSVYRDGALVGASTTASYTDAGLAASTTYGYTVQAVDAAGNHSDLSLPASAATLSASPVPGELWLGMGFEEATGNQVLDSSAYGHNGTLTTGMLRSTSGRYGKAVEFTGNGGYVSLGNLDIPGSAMTLACWFRADDFGDSVARLISKAASAADADHYWMLGTVNSGGMKLRYRLKTSGGLSTLVSTVGITAGVWTHVAATYDGATMRLYINGQTAGSLARTGTTVQNALVPAALGAQPQGDRRFDGLMDEIRIYRRALTGAEIQAMMTEALAAPLAGATLGTSAGAPGLTTEAERTLIIRMMPGANQAVISWPVSKRVSRLETALVGSGEAWSWAEVAEVPGVTNGFNEVTVEVKESSLFRLAFP